MHEYERNLPLELAVVTDGRHRYAIAAAAGVNATTFSGVISGRVIPSAAVRARIALALGRAEHELFDEQVSA